MHPSGDAVRDRLPHRDPVHTKQPRRSGSAPRSGLANSAAKPNIPRRE
jgi:hypothetical protein